MKEVNRLRLINSIIILSWLIVLSIVLSPNITILKSIGEYAVVVMLGFLVVGMLFFFVNQRRLFLNSFACCAALCLFLKSASNDNLRAPEENQQLNFSIAHINLSSAEDDYMSLLKEIHSEAPDIVSVQELTPDWSRLLSQELKESYPHSIFNVRIDPYGMAIFSKYPLAESDTTYFGNIPILESKIDLPESSNVKLSNTLLIPSINAMMDSLQNNQIVQLSDRIALDSSKHIVLGDFNMVYWSSRIRDFRSITKLKNSRRDLSQSVLSVPYDHIFYDPRIECTSFKDMVDEEGHRFGIIGTYQFKTMSAEL